MEIALVIYRNDISDFLQRIFVWSFQPVLENKLASKFKTVHISDSIQKTIIEFVQFTYLTTPPQPTLPLGHELGVMVLIFTISDS